MVGQGAEILEFVQSAECEVRLRMDVSGDPKIVHAKMVDPNDPPEEVVELRLELMQARARIREQYAVQDELEQQIQNLNERMMQIMENASACVDPAPAPASAPAVDLPRVVLAPNFLPAPPSSMPLPQVAPAQAPAWSSGDLAPPSPAPDPFPPPQNVLRRFTTGFVDLSSLGWGHAISRRIRAALGVADEHANTDDLSAHEAQAVSSHVQLLHKVVPAFVAVCMLAVAFMAISAWSSASPVASDSRVEPAVYSKTAPDLPDATDLLERMRAGNR